MTGPNDVQSSGVTAFVLCAECKRKIYAGQACWVRSSTLCSACADKPSSNPAGEGRNRELLDRLVRAILGDAGVDEVLDAERVDRAEAKLHELRASHRALTAARDENAAMYTELRDKFYAEVKRHQESRRENHELQKTLADILFESGEWQRKAEMGDDQNPALKKLRREKDSWAKLALEYHAQLEDTRQARKALDEALVLLREAVSLPNPDVSDASIVATAAKTLSASTIK